MKEQRLRLWVVVVSLALCVPAAAEAQQRDPRVNPPVQPIPAPGESSSKAPAEGVVEAAPAVKEDTRPLAGVEDFEVRGSGGRSYLLPSLRVFQSVDTNPRTRTTTGSSDIGAMTLVSGTLAWRQEWATSSMALDYTAGGVLYNNHRGLNAPVHRLGFTQTFNARRWTVRLADRFNYTPESAFGLGFGGLSTPRWNPNFEPNDSIITDRGDRVSNAFLAQASYMLSPRSMLTMAGSAGLQRFIDGTGLDSNQYGFSAGYEYMLRNRDWVSVGYMGNLKRMTGFRFPGQITDIDTHSVALGYGRRITGRMALRISGGPQVSLLDRRDAGSVTRAGWNLHSSLNYAYSRGIFGLSYSRFTSTGSGALNGAETQTVAASLGRQLTRMWSASFTTGYARNTSLRENLPDAQRHFNTWYSGVSLTRPLGRYVNMQARYHFQWQNSNQAFCLGGTCGTSLARHQFGIGFTWRLRPIDIE